MHNPKTLFVAAVLAIGIGGAMAQSAEDGGAALPPPPPAGTGPAIRVYFADMIGWGEVANMTLAEGETLYLTIELVNSQGEPMPEKSVKVTSTLGNDVNAAAVTTNDKGQAEVEIAASKQGLDTIKFTGEGAGATLALQIKDPVAAAADKQHTFNAVPKRAALQARAGVVPWETLAEVKLANNENGYTANFSKRVLAMNGQKVKLQGFLLPLDNDEKQKHFILSANPPTCFFCLPGGPESLVEVQCEEGVRFSFDPIVLSGKLEVLEQNEMGLLYRMTAAQVSDDEEPPQIDVMEKFPLN
jgi:hypothetical protein